MSLKEAVAADLTHLLCQPDLQCCFPVYPQTEATSTVFRAAKDPKICKL